MAGPIESAKELYREIKKRGLHLRAEEGRDDSLLQELCVKLGCPDRRLAEFLERSDLPAADFLRSFLQLTAPFAMMFKEIWEFLAAEGAPDARETIRVRFGLGEPIPIELDLDAFREYVRTGETVLAMAPATLWTSEDLGLLFELAYNVLGVKYDAAAQPSRHYRPGEPYQMPPVRGDSDEFTTMVRSVRDAFQSIADAHAKAVMGLRTLPELKSGVQEVWRLPSHRSAVLLTDLLPTWNVVFARAHAFPEDLRRAAVEHFNRVIAPRLRRETTETDADVLAALDILSLPFWKNRWQTYEIWATVRVLQALSPFCPRLVIRDGYCALDGFEAGTVALLDSVSPDARVVLQMQTPYISGRRKAIKPDLSICRDATLSPASRAAVVEFKQRAALDPAHVEEVGSSYLDGSPGVGGVVIVNYDEVRLAARLPPKVHLLEGVRPDRVSQVVAMGRLVLDSLRAAGLEPRPTRIVALLDVSSSMGRLYDSPAAQAGLQSLLRLTGVKVLRFNDGLVEGGDLPAEGPPDSVETSGGTDLGLALQQLDRTLGAPEALLLVSDHGYNQPAELDSVPRFKEVAPEDLLLGTAWLVDLVRNPT